MRRVISASVTVEFDPKKETLAGVLSATFTRMGEGIANGQTKGPLTNGGTWAVNGLDHINKGA